MYRTLSYSIGAGFLLILLCSAGCQTTKRFAAPVVPARSDQTNSFQNRQDLDSDKIILASDKDLVSDPVSTEPQTVAELSPVRTGNPATLSKESKRMMLSWAMHTLLRAQSMMHGSDDVSQLLDAAMARSPSYRKDLAERLNYEGIAEADCEKMLAQVESRIRSTTRDFILRAKTILKRQPQPTRPARRADAQMMI